LEEKTEEGSKKRAASGRDLRDESFKKQKGPVFKSNQEHKESRKEHQEEELAKWLFNAFEYD
jgi:hypothetical protein